jgi:hypothetical protein
MKGGTGGDESPGASAQARRSRSRTRGRSQAKLRDRAGGALLAVAVAGSALAFGAQHTVPLLVAALAAAGAAILLVPARVPPAGWLLIGLSIYCFIQLLPLPFALLEWLSPAAANVWRGALVDLGPATPRFAPLSVDPSATALEALKWSGYACALNAAAGWRARHRSLALALLVFGAGLLVCVVTLAHGVLNLERIYGYFRPTDVSRWVRGPFVNGNNLAGYLNLALFAGAGLALSGRVERGTPALVSAVVLLGAGSLLASSRAGTVALALGVVLFTVLVLAQRRNSGRFVLIAGAVAAMGLAIAATFSARRVFGTLLDTQMLAKVSVWRWSLDLIGDFPVFGAGRGAFENAFPPYRQPLPGDAGIAVHAESFPLQWAADWGIPVSVLALAMLGFLARRGLRRAKSDPVSAGIFTGLAVLFLQNFADLGLELFSVSVAAVVAYAAIDEPANASPSARVLGPAQALVVLAAVLALLLGATPPQVERRKAQRAYAALARASKAELRAFKADLGHRLRRHPGDGFFPLLGGLVAERLQENPMPWLGRAIERTPTSSSAHLALSDALARRGAGRQSLLHARLAATYDFGRRHEALGRIASRLRSKADLQDSFPSGLPGSDLLARLCPLVEPGLRVDCQRLVLERSASRENEHSLAQGLIVALERGDAPCRDSASACADEAGRLLDRLEASHAERDTGLAELRARLLAHGGRRREAASLLVDRCPAGDDATRCLNQALDLALAARDENAIELVMARYAPLVCADPAACGALHERVGRGYAELPADAAALRRFLDAAKVSPTPERWLAAAEVAVRLGAGSTATLALERASREPELSDEQRSRLAAVQAKLDGAVIE